tara:strand:- start:352 stop:573 length:222 start_codon:yes stop_codon:yes gene_type:complete
MKITNDVVAELQKIRNAIDDAYDKLNITLYEKSNAVKVKYTVVNPSTKVTDNFEYIVKKLNTIRDESQVLGEE